MPSHYLSIGYVLHLQALCIRFKLFLSVKWELQRESSLSCHAICPIS